MANSRLQWWGIVGILILNLITANPVYADLASDRAQLERLQLLFEKDNQAALEQLKTFYAGLDLQTDYELRIETLRELAFAYNNAGDKKASDGARKEMLRLATEKNDKELIALSRFDEVYQLHSQGQFDEALIIIDQIAAVVVGSKRPLNLMRLELGYASTYHAASKFDLALSHYLNALRLTDQLPSQRVLYKIRRLDSLAGLYFTMQNPEKALAVSDEGLGLLSQVDSPRLTASFRLHQGLALTELKRYPEALVAYERALSLAKTTKLPKLEALVLSNIADIHLRAHQFVKAEQVARASLKSAEAIDDEHSLSNAKYNIGFALGGQGKISQAMEYLGPELKRTREQGDKADIEATVGEIGRMFEHAKMYKEALEYTREQQKLQNEIFRADRAKAVATLQEQFDAEQRKKQIELLARENQIKDTDLKNGRLQQMVTLLGAMVTVMVGVFIYMLYRKVKQTNARLEEMNQQLEFHSVRDPLTGLHNRRTFLDMMHSRDNNPEHDRRQQDGAAPDCLMILDIDHFKHINDTWGHGAGDVVLVEVAKRLASAVRDSDLCLRWGGEEFLVFAPKTKPEQLTTMVERVLRSIGSTPVIAGQTEIPVTVSAGYIALPFSDVPEDKCNWEKAMQLADMALYLGKVNGRNRAYGLMKLLVPYEQALPELERDFSDALKQNMVDVNVVLGPGASPSIHGII